MKGKTVIAIAHRLSTLREMDRIIVMQKGKIIEEGINEIPKRRVMKPENINRRIAAKTINPRFLRARFKSFL